MSRARRVSRGLGLEVIAAWAMVGVAVVLPTIVLGQTGARPDSVPVKKKYLSVQDSPGYYLIPDPESMSVKIGRRLNAPVVSKPFTGGTKSMAEMGRTVCRFLHHEAADSLYRLCISEEELRDIMWLEFPQSRPAAGLTAEDAWGFTYTRLISGTRDAVADYGGRHYEFVRWEQLDTTAVYKNFKLHNGLILVAKRDDGEILKMDWLRAVAERKGRFKIQSVRD